MTAETVKPAKPPVAKLTPEQLAEAAYGGKTAREQSEFTPAQLAAAAYELQKPRIAAKDAIWGTVEGDAGRTDIQHADPRLDYRILDTALFAPDGRALYTARQRLTNRGYEPISGPLYQGASRPEFVGISTAEIWAREIALDDEEFRVRIARSCLSPRFADYYHRRCVAEDAPEKRWLPEALEYAMLVHHDLMPDSKSLLTKPGQTRDAARERLIITNLARRVEVHPRGTAPDPVREAFADVQRG